MTEQLISTSISLELHDSVKCSLNFDCGSCGLTSYVTIERGKDGTVSLGSPNKEDRFQAPNLSPSKPVWVLTGAGRLLISCGSCLSGKTFIEVTAKNIGTFCTSSKGSRCESKNSKGIQCGLPRDHRCQHQNGISHAQWS